jgi:hypothetical protein
MDEQDLWLIELLQLCKLYQKEIRKGICITFKAETSSWQLQKTGKLQLGPGLVILKNGAILDGWTAFMGNRVGSNLYTLPKGN